MLMKLTKKQVIILDFISDFTEQNGYSPSYREIMTALDLRSVSSVAEHVDNLVKKGALRKKENSARSLEIVDTSFPETTELFKFRIENAESEDDKNTLIKAARILGLNLD